MINWHNPSTTDVALLGVAATLLAAVMSAVSAYVATLTKAKAEERANVRKEYREYLRGEYLPFLTYVTQRPPLVANLYAVGLFIASEADKLAQFEDLAKNLFATVKFVDPSLPELNNNAEITAAIKKFVTAEGDVSDVLRKWSETKKMSSEVLTELNRLMHEHAHASVEVRRALEDVVWPTHLR